jgi:hypothetical protein
MSRRKVAFLAVWVFMGLAVSALQPGLSAVGCPVDGANCTDVCWWAGSGCSCLNVDCVGSVCKYTSCNATCCPNGCTGQACTITP